MDSSRPQRVCVFAGSADGSFMASEYRDLVIVDADPSRLLDRR